MQKLYEMTIQAGLESTSTSTLTDMQSLKELELSSISWRSPESYIR